MPISSPRPMPPRPGTSFGIPEGTTATFIPQPMNDSLATLINHIDEHLREVTEMVTGLAKRTSEFVPVPSTEPEAFAESPTLEQRLKQTRNNLYSVKETLSSLTMFI